MNKNIEIEILNYIYNEKNNKAYISQIEKKYKNINIKKVLSELSLKSEILIKWNDNESAIYDSEQFCYLLPKGIHRLLITTNEEYKNNFLIEIEDAKENNYNLDLYFSYLLYSFLNPCINYKEYCIMFDLDPNNSLKLDK